MMFCIIITSCSFFSFSFYSLLGFNQDELPTVDRTLDRVLNHTLDKLQKKQPIIMIGLGGSKKDSKKETIDIRLMLNKSLTKEECRGLIVECVEEYLKDINSDIDLKQYLHSFPFTYQNLGVIIFLTNPDGSSITYPNLCDVILHKGLVIYDAHDPDNKYGYKSTEEPYEEALKIVQTEK